MRINTKAITKQSQGLLLVVAVLLLACIMLFARAHRAQDGSETCQEYYAAMKNPPIEALSWCQAGSYFTWKSTLPENAAFEAVNIFSICQGDPSKPAILLIHGYPTSSYDFAGLADQLVGLLTNPRLVKKGGTA